MLSIILIWAIVSHKHGIGEKGGFFLLGKGPKFGLWRWAENPLALEKLFKVFVTRISPADLRPWFLMDQI